MLIAVPFAIVYPFADDLVDGARQLGEMSPVFAFLAVIALLLIDGVAAIPHGLVGALAGSAMHWAAAWLATWLGLMGASTISYGLGRFAGRPLATRIVGEEDMAAAEKRASGISALLLFATRPVPVVGEMILVAAGIAKYPFRRFLLAVGSANAILCIGYVGLGQFFGEVDNTDIALIATFGVPVAGGLIYLVSRMVFGRRSARV